MPQPVDVFSGLYTAAQTGDRRAYLVYDGAMPTRLDVERWSSGLDAADVSVLDRCVGPVLDVGCGPGRFTVAAIGLGMNALGIDIAAAAVGQAVKAGASVLHRSVFHSVPREGEWSTVLLIDGNVGIGGDPGELLRRCAELIGPHGRLLIEVEPDGVDVCFEACLMTEAGWRSSPFPWARVGTDALLTTAAGEGLRLHERWESGRRVFCDLRR